MKLNEEQAAELFPDDRGDGEIGSFHLGIEMCSDGGCIVTTDNEEFVLSEQQKLSLLDDCGFDSVWHIVSRKEQVLDWLDHQT